MSALSLWLFFMITPGVDGALLLSLGLYRSAMWSTKSSEMPKLRSSKSGSISSFSVISTFCCMLISMLSFILLVLTYLAFAILSREQDLNSQMGPGPEAVSAADELSLDAFSPPARSLAQRMERHGRGADLLRFQERIVEKFLRRNDPCSGKVESAPVKFGVSSGMCTLCPTSVLDLWAHTNRALWRTNMVTLCNTEHKQHSGLLARDRLRQYPLPLLRLLTH